MRSEIASRTDDAAAALIGAYERWARASADLVDDAMRWTRPWTDAYLGLLRGGASRAFGCACEIPERECPPRCLCQLRWRAARGETAHGTVRVVNTGPDARTFRFEVDAFEGPSGPTAVVPVIAPTSASLEPGRSATVDISFPVDEHLEAGAVFAAEMRIVGRYVQCVCLTLEVTRRCPVHCDVEAGEIPTCIRAHQWYDHFQCEEPCFESAGTAGSVPGAAAPTARPVEPR
jgi:hypothetical protein